MANFDNIVFIYNAMAGQFLDGLPSANQVVQQASIMTEAVGQCDYTGTQWQLATLTDGTISIRNLGDQAGTSPYFLDGRTVLGSVGLAPGTGEGWSGTHWLFIPQAGGYVISCQGTGGNQYQYLQLANNVVQLAPPTTSPDGTMIWTLYELSVITPPSAN